MTDLAAAARRHEAALERESRLCCHIMIAISASLFCPLVALILALS